MLRHLSLYLYLVLLITQAGTALAQNARLSVRPGEVRIINGNLVVERNRLIVLPDADYVIGNDGGIFILPEISQPRTIQLPAAATNAYRQISLIDKTSGINRWTITGGFVTRLNTGLPPFNAEDSVELDKGSKVILFSDSAKWWDIHTGGGAASATPPVVDAGENITLPSNATQVNLSATVTPGNTPLYTTLWHVIRKPDEANIYISDTTNNNITVTGMTPGNYTFRVTVTDDLGLRAIDSVKVYITWPARMFYAGGYMNNVYDTSTGRQAWIYLPDGYNPEDSVKYPMIMFLHGLGENGTDPQGILTVSGGLPKLLYDKAFEMESIVVIPQLTTGYWQGVTAKKAYDWALAGYKIDPDRVYVTGLSSGGGGTGDAVFGNPTLFAAYLAVSSLENALKYNGASVKNIPAMFAHGYQDVYVTVKNSLEMVDVINKAQPQGIYPPIMRTTWRGNHNEFFWNNYIYDKRFAPIDFERDFLLMYSKNRVHTATNFVQRAETLNDYTEYAIAKKLVDKLPSGQDKTALLNRLSIKLQSLTNGVNYYVIDPGVAAFAEIANTNKITSAAANTVKQNLVSVTGATSAIDFSIISSANPVMLDTCPVHDYLGFDQSMYRDGIQVIDTGVSMKLSGLSAAASYDLRIFYSNRSQIRTQQTGFRITANDRSGESVEDGYNTTKYIDLFNVRADAQGEIMMRLDSLYGYYGVVNVILVKEKIVAPPSQRSQFNFGVTPGNVPGWIDVNGDPVTEVLEVADEATGFVLTTYDPNSWRRYIISHGSDNGGMETGTFSAEFPVGVVKSYFQNFNLKFNGSNFGLEIKKQDGQGLEAGTYQIKVMSSVKSTVYNTGEGEIYVKFGSGATQLQRLVPANNSGQFRTFTGQITAGETIKISVNRSSLNLSDNAFINGLIVEKVN